MSIESAECDLRAVGMTAHTSQAGGGSIGAKETDVSSGHAVCSRDAHGSTDPATPDKSPPKTEREFERAMRQLGYSKRQAREIAARGFKAMAEAEPAVDTNDLNALLERMKQLFDERQP
jgi:uncharacterized membrane protein